MLLLHCFNSLSYGFLEKVYENALIRELRLRGLNAEAQVPIKVMYKGEIVGEYFADIVVQGRVIIELKVVEKIMKINEAQLLNYLRGSGMRYGVLVNFTYPKAEIRRYVYDEKKQLMEEGHESV